MYLYLFFSMLSGILELGIVLQFFIEGMSIKTALLMGTMYQLGNLLFVIKLPRRQEAVKIGFISLFLGLINCFHSSIILQAVQTALLSLNIQTVRAGYKTNCPTSLKRLFRIGGFLLSPLMTIFPKHIIILCSILSLIAIVQKTDINTKEEIKDKKIVENISVTMIFHQMHYFVYTYIMPLTVMELTKNAFLCVTIYALTWVIYLLPGLLAEKGVAYKPKTVFTICHTFLAITMGVLSLAFATKNIIIGFFAWLFTGLGGGSVFCIKQLVSEEKKSNMDLSENIGHFLGAILALFVSIYIQEGSIGAVLTGLSCLFVCMTLLSTTFETKKQGRKNQWQN